MTYRKLKVTNRGKQRVLYYKNGRLIKQRNVPEAILNSSVFGEPIDIPETPEELDSIPKEDLPLTLRPDKACVFCGEFGKLERFINLRMVYLCEEHYKNTSTGAIVAHLREKELNAQA